MLRALAISALFALAGAARAQVNFDSPGGTSFASLIADAPSVPVPVPSAEPEACEAFSAENSMSLIPVYDQQLGANPDNDSGICFAVVAGQMFDHWAMTRGPRAPGLTSPMMMAAARALRQAASGEEGESGGELTAGFLREMAADACTFGLTPGSRSALSIDDELGLAGLEPGFGGHKRLMDPEVFRGVPCRPAPASGFTPVYQRTRQVETSSGRRGVPFTVEEVRAFFARNSAGQPVAVKGNYGAMFGSEPGGVPHWALVTARQPRDGRCMYLLRNSMGSDTPSRWMEEGALVQVIRSMAVLTP